MEYLPSDEEDDRLLAESTDILESLLHDDEQRAGNLFEFQLLPTGPRRHWRNVVSKQVFDATLVPTRVPTRADDLGRELTGALRRAIQSRIDEDGTLQPHHQLHFVMQATTDVFRHPFQSATFTVQDFMDDTNPRLDTYLQTLAGKLNSNESFDADTSLHTELTLIRNPAPGRGHGKRYRAATAAVRKMNKHCRVTIDSDDNLCCARAIVTMRAWCHKDDGGEDDRGRVWQTIRHGDRDRRTLQKRQAQELHRLAGVPEGPCRLAEVAKFQAVLPDYQIKVMTEEPPYGLIYKGLTPSDKIIMLLKSDRHYDGCNSFAAFLSRSYYCHECDTGFDHDDFANHPCQGRWCACCRTKDCPGYMAAKQSYRHPRATVDCTLCHRSFYGDACLACHYRTQLCQKLKKCRLCHNHYHVGGKHPRHKCGWSECGSCGQRVEVATHRCFIQPEGEDCDVPRLKTVPVNSVGTRAVVSMNAEAGTAQVERQPPLLVYADYEAYTTDTGEQKPIMVCCESAEEVHTHTFDGDNCTSEFFDHLNELSVDEDGDDRSIIILFHNFKGYDGMFILQHLYRTQREVTDQIVQGAKVLSLRSGSFTFKDSLCFLPFPLASFPATFGLTELKKGFFPHKFNTRTNWEYEGPMPPADAYDPEGMSLKKKAEFEVWYDDLVRRGYVFNMRREMREYCVSDVKLLKGGCSKFQEEFYAEAEFYPMEKCITIASSCHRFWRKTLLRRNTIAVEPPRGWHGARSNQSHKARQWLAWQEHLRRQQTSTEGDFIRHSHNGGEVRLAGRHLVDGYDQTTNTAYEFHGCLWHGCTSCFPDRTVHSKLNPDRTFSEMREATRAKEEALRAYESLSLVCHAPTVTGRKIPTWHVMRPCSSH